MDGREHKPTMPSSIDSENTILGAILLDNDEIQIAAEQLDAEDFYSPMNRRIFGAMLELFKAQKPIDSIILGDLLKTEQITAKLISELMFGLPVNIKLNEYITAVRHKSNLRQLIRTCNQIAASAEDDPHDTVFSGAQAKINALCEAAESGHSETHFTHLHRIIDNEVIHDLGELRAGVSRKMRLGFPGIDHAIGGGIAASDVLLVGADTGKGKSALALQLAYNFAVQGIPTAFLAGEMTNAENVKRLLSQVSGVTNLNWAQHISEVEYEHLIGWANSIRNAPIQFEHRISDLQTLATHLRSIVRRNKVKVLVIDYIQLFKMEKMDRRKRNERIAEASQEVKRLANELNIGIIEVAQFNREGAKSVQAGLHDFEGSGQLEKDASLIFILEVGDIEFADDQGLKYLDAKVRVVKGRNVAKSEVVGRYYGRSVRFAFN